MFQLPVRDAGRTRRALLEVACHIYQKDGFQATSLQRMAKELGISGPAIYYHFRSKAELLVEGYRWRIGRMVEVHQRIHPDLTASEDLWIFTALHVHLQLFPGYDGPYRFGAAQLLTLVTEEESAPLREVMRLYTDELVEILNRGMKAREFSKGPVTPIAFAIFGMDQHIAQWYSAEGKCSASELANLYADLALRLVGSTQKINRPKLRRLTENALKADREEG
jgi:AcrR family transcriptional regulator